MSMNKRTSPRQTPLKTMPRRPQEPVRLRVGDFIRKRDRLYRVEEVSIDYALAVPQGRRARERAFLIRPPVTTAYIQLESDVARIEQLVREGRREVAVSAIAGSQVRYGDGRWSVFPMAGGRTESSRRKH
jgi:hypothetical protein